MNWSSDANYSSHAQRVQVRPPIRQRKNRNGDRLAVEVGNRQADAFNRHRAFVNHPWPHVVGHAYLQRPVRGLAVEVLARSRQITGSSDASSPQPSTWPCTMCPPSGLSCGSWQLQIHLAPAASAPREVLSSVSCARSAWKSRVHIQRRQANAGDAQRVALAQPRRKARSFHSDAPNAAALCQSNSVPVCSMMPVNMILFYGNRQPGISRAQVLTLGHGSSAANTVPDRCRTAPLRPPPSGWARASRETPEPRPSP